MPPSPAPLGNIEPVTPPEPQPANPAAAAPDSDTCPLVLPPVAISARVVSKALLVMAGPAGNSSSPAVIAVRGSRDSHPMSTAPSPSPLCRMTRLPYKAPPPPLRKSSAAALEPRAAPPRPLARLCGRLAMPPPACGRLLLPLCCWRRWAEGWDCKAGWTVWRESSWRPEMAEGELLEMLSWLFS